MARRTKASVGAREPKVVGSIPIGRANIFDFQSKTVRSGSDSDRQDAAPPVNFRVGRLDRSRSAGSPREKPALGHSGHVAGVGV